MTSTELTDLALRASKDRAALNLLVWHETARVQREIRTVYPHRYSEWDDMEQTVMEALCRSISSYKGMSTFDTWWNRLRWNRYADYMRNYYRWHGVHELSGLVGYTERVSSKQFCSLSLEIDELVTQASERWREIWELRRIGKSFVEIGTALGMDEEKARSRYRRGILYIQRRLQQREAGRQYVKY